MPTITIDFAAADLSTERAAFLSHLHWLHAFNALAGFDSSPGSTSRTLLRLAQSAAAFPVPRVPGGNLPEVMGCLNRAWGTELVLCGTRQYANEDALIRIANSWAAVQAYYAAYGATQALITAAGHPRPTSHESTQTMYSDLWIARGMALSPAAFAVASKGDKRAAADGTVNGPGRTLAPVSPLSGCTASNCWELAEQALRTTREDALTLARKRSVADKLKRKRREWTDEETVRLAGGKKARVRPDWWNAHPRLSAPQKQAMDDRLRPYTLLDYLCRLRMKANYEDARMYTDGPADQGEAEAMNSQFLRLTAAILIVHEVRVGKLFSRDRFMESVDAWLAKNAPQNSGFGIAARRNILEGAL